MPEGAVVRRGEGQRFDARGSAMIFKATAEATNGVFSLMERELPAEGTPPPAHTHAGHEAFYVLEGEIEFRLGGETTVARAGEFVLVPPGTPHTFANVSQTSARLLILHAPAADAYFADLDALWSGPEPPDAAAQAALMRRHGIEPISS